MPLNRTRFVSLVALLAIAVGGHSLRADDDAALAFFEKKIRPVLVDRCYRCHSAKSEEIKGNLRLDWQGGIREGGDSGPAVVPHKPQESLLLAALRYEDFEMPPTDKLPDRVVADFAKWIEMGAPDPRKIAPEIRDKAAVDVAASRQHWAFEPLATLSPPAVRDTNWPRSPIDRFVLAGLEKAGINASVDADRVVLMRRLYSDLVGLPPTLTEQESFLNDESPGAIERLVDRLLDSTHFGERWGRHWLDLARFAESNGGDRNVIHPHAWRYRNYVVDAFNSDKPFDEFLREQIAGDLLPADSSDERDAQLVATGLLTLGPKLFMETDAERFRMDVVDEQIDVVSRAMLGLTVSCARCHDHKFDPIPTRDYYALAGIFRSTYLLYGTAAPAGNQYGHDRPLQPIGKDAAKLEGPANEWHLAVADQTKVRNTARSDRYRVVRKKAAQENKRKMLAAGKSPEVQREDAEIKALDDEIAMLAAEIKEWDERIVKLDEELKALTDNPPVFPDYCMAVRDDEQPADSPLYTRGDVKRPGKTVPRGFLSALPTSSETSIAEGTSGRRELAFWLTHPDNPLPARVTVNRIWQHLFGEGLVRSVDNFGRTGDKPAHPELLDYLAETFRRDGWSVKRIIRRIVLSRSYQLASMPDVDRAAVDPENRLLWRQNSKQLEVEVLRDSILQSAGNLDRSRPATSVVSTFAEPEFNARVTLSDEQKESQHRTLYLPVARFHLPEILDTFDFPDPSLLTGRRGERTMPAQQLFLMNNPWVIGQARQLATRLLDQAGVDDASRVEQAFRRVLCHRPTVGERARLLAFLQRECRTPPADADGKEENDDTKADPRLHAWTVVCQTLFASAEFRYLQ